MSSQVDLLMFLCKEILSQFINKDHLSIHLRNVIRESKERRKLFLNYTKDILNVSCDSEGLHIIGKLTHELDDVEASGIVARK